MYLAPLAYALQSHDYGLRSAYRSRIVGDCRHLTRIEHDPKSFGYRLRRILLNGSQIIRIYPDRDFWYITDLFTTAKQEGFFEDVNPYATNWQGSRLPILAPKQNNEDNKKYSYFDVDNKKHTYYNQYYDIVTYFDEDHNKITYYDLREREYEDEYSWD